MSRTKAEAKADAAIMIGQSSRLGLPVRKFKNFWGGGNQLKTPGSLEGMC